MKTKKLCKKIPCEIVTWYVLPVIRQEIAMLLVKNHGVSQKEAASLLGVTDAAVSQYLSKKRGKTNFYKIDENEFEKAARRIADGASAKEEMCQLCKFLVSQNILEKIENERSG